MHGQRVILIDVGGTAELAIPTEFLSHEELGTVISALGVAQRVYRKGFEGRKYELDPHVIEPRMALITIEEAL